MAILPSTIDFLPRPVNHVPSQFGFGFGLGGSAVVAHPWQSNPIHSAFHHPSTSFNPPVRAQKRRHEEEEPAPSRDHSMDRSPTPERPKRAPPKRARVSPTGSKEERDAKENKAPSPPDENDVDVGVLLASLPSQSLLPLLTSLLSAQPSLKSVILPLIPRPTLETALQALSVSARKLRDAYPYSTNSSAAFGSGASRPAFGAFGRLPIPQTQSSFPQSNGGMRDSYIVSRLRPHISEFMAACLSYLPYFSYLAVPSQSASMTTATQSHSTTLQTLHRGHLHPSETYSFLAALTEHLFSQPPLTQSSLAPLLLPRLSEEWKAWVNKLDVHLNQDGGMFAADVVRLWERGLDGFANAQVEGAETMRSTRDLWISKVGWLVGRQPMEDI
ncbi:hypothetical protein GGX14DRAFT_421308 [Mycena pura]|uniref:Tethering factor for nuclear proteasome STS1 n=1 Tax=Mycena pura TaxID=153505 RepID=A0AAD6YPM4_9AGAR|nr:hypothetical protein GGX14DRAFT_421308 [Mycena pura]